MGDKRLYDDASGLTAFWLVAGVGTAMLAGHMVLRTMQRMASAGTPSRMAKGPLGAFGWMFEPPAAPTAEAPSPARRPSNDDAIDAEEVTPVETVANAAEASVDAARETVEAVAETAGDLRDAAVAEAEPTLDALRDASGEVAREITEAATETAEVVGETARAAMDAPVKAARKARAAGAKAKRVAEEAAGPAAEATAPMIETAGAAVTEPVEAPAEMADTRPGDTAEAAPEAETSAVSPFPSALDAPRGPADDLKRIKGVGPKLEATLRRLGYFHFDQIAGWGPDELARVDESLGDFAGRATRDDWIGQAKLLGGSVH